MKMNARHIVPLSHQAVAILHELQPLTGKGRYIFPGAQDRDRFMSENTVNGALRRLGYTNAEMTGHGFRSMASTMLNDMFRSTSTLPTRYPTESNAEKLYKSIWA
jgi:integrase